MHARVYVCVRPKGVGCWGRGANCFIPGPIYAARHGRVNTIPLRRLIPYLPLPAKVYRKSQPTTALQKIPRPPPKKKKRWPTKTTTWSCDVKRFCVIWKLTRLVGNQKYSSFVKNSQIKKLFWDVVCFVSTSRKSGFRNMYDYCNNTKPILVKPNKHICLLTNKS